VEALGVEVQVAELRTRRGTPGILFRGAAKRGDLGFVERGRRLLRRGRRRRGRLRRCQRLTAGRLVLAADDPACDQAKQNPCDSECDSVCFHAETWIISACGPKGPHYGWPGPKGPQYGWPGPYYGLRARQGTRGPRDRGLQTLHAR